MKKKIGGFIKLSDFPGIDYLMTQYHYYDQGYNLRFGSASNKIYDNASVLNDVMMAYLRLKVCLTDTIDVFCEECCTKIENLLKENF